MGHADCSDRPLYELLSTAPMPRIQSRWPFLQISSLKFGGTELQVRCYALPSVRRRLAHRMNMFSVAELETNVEGEEDWWIECRSYNSTWRAKRHIFWSWALYRAGISVVRVTCSARKLHQYAVWHALLISTRSNRWRLRWSQRPNEVMHW